jgi:hypothetical protein
MKNTFFVIFSVLLVVALVVVFFSQKGPIGPTTPSTSHPLIRVTSPLPNELVESPLYVAGEARGNWFFEASFPVRLVDANGKNIPLDPPYIMTAADWMTTEFVPFEATLNFAPPTTDTGTLILEKDNPSGLPEHEVQPMEIPVRFIKSTLTDPVGMKPCVRTGCSGQICSDEDVVTTCEFLPQYACYWTAACERQANGQCGFTLTPELISCLARNQ